MSAEDDRRTYVAGLSVLVESYLSPLAAIADTQKVD
jgi:hypothetical protein